MFCSIGFGTGDSGLGLAKNAKFNKDIIVWHGVACRVVVCRAEGRRMFRVPHATILQSCIIHGTRRAYSIPQKKTI